MGNILGVSSTWGRSNRNQTSATDNVQVPMNPQHNPSESSGNPTDAQDGQICGDLSPISPLSKRLSSLRALAANVAAFSLLTHRKVWRLIEDLAGKNAGIESRNVCFSYFVAVAALPDLTLDDVDTLSTLIREEVVPPLVSKQVTALEILLDYEIYITTLRDGFNRFVLSTLRSQYDFVANSRKLLKGQRSDAIMSEVHGLHALLAFLLRLVSGGLSFINEPDIPALVDQLLYITKSSVVLQDRKGVLSVLRNLIDLGKVPMTHLKECIHVLCGMCFIKNGLEMMAWDYLTRLCRTGTDKYAVEILMEIIDKAPLNKEQRRVRGALRMLTFLFTTTDRISFPLVSFHELIRCIERVHLVCESYQRDSLHVMQKVLGNEIVRDRILNEDWSGLFEILNRAITTLPQNLNSGAKKNPPHITAFKSPSEYTTFDDWNNYREQQSKAIASSLRLIYPIVRLDKQESICVFYLMAAMPPVPEAIVDDVVAAFLSHVPSAASNSLPKLLTSLVLNEALDPEKRASILERLREAVPDRPSTVQQDQFRRLISELMSRLPREQNIRLINASAALATYHARMAEIKEVDNIVQNLIAFVDLEGTASYSTMVEPPSNTVTSSLVGLFLYYMTRSAEKAVLLYDALVELINSTEHPPSALTAMKLMSRLRNTASTSISLTTAGTSSHHTPSGAGASSSNAIMVVAVPDSLGLAAFLSRTEASSAFLTTFNLRNADSESAVEPSQSRAGRSSTISSPGTSRPKTRSTSGQSRGLRPTPPLWMYPGRRGLPEDPPKTPSQFLQLCTSESDPKTTLKINAWLETMIKILQKPKDWEIYSYTLVHLPSQLSNPLLFSNSIPQIQHLRSLIVDQLNGERFHDPPPNSGVKKGDVALCLVHSLIMLIAYKEYFSPNEQEMVVRTFVFSQGQFDRVSKTCIQALTVCCYELPQALTRSLPDILPKMAQMITKAHLAMDILEFLGALATLPHVHSVLTEKEVGTVFVICVRHLEHSREQREKLHRNSAPSAPSRNPNRQSAISFGSDSSQNIEVHKDLPQYIYALAYHVMTFWFLSLKLVDRPRYAGYITSWLSSVDAEGNHIMEEQSQVTLDMMHRTTYLDLGETRADPQFTPSDGTVLKKSWLVGLSIVTIETAVGTGLTQITKRQASGTTYATYFPHTAPLPPHHIPMAEDSMSINHGPDARVNIFPSHVFLQLSSTIAPTPTPMEPICLPDDEAVQRAISAFDRNDTVDGYKAGVIYVGNGQSSEADILANTTHSPAFTSLLEGLGTKVALKGATFNTQGLDRQSNSDGEFTYAWRNRVVEIVYHVPSMMPTNKEHDPQCVLKKRHIGNDFVNIIYNDSGLPFDFNTFASQFNYVNIVVTPDGLFAPEPKLDTKLETVVESSHSSSSSSTKSKRHSRHGSISTTPPTMEATSGPALTPTATSSPPLPKTFKVQTLLHPSFPPLSPAHTCKSITRYSLAPFLRQIALNACVFSHAWSAREMGEHVSSWRNRLRDIYRLRERYGQSGNVSAGVGEEVEAKGKRSTSGFTGLFGGGTGDRSGITRESQLQGAKAERTYSEGDKWIGQVRMGGLSEEEGVRAGLDFSRWAGENPRLK